MNQDFQVEVCSESITDIILSNKVDFNEASVNEIWWLRDIIKDKVVYFINNKLPIEFSMSAFSLKCQIEWKCISNLPDMAEFDAIKVFDKLANDIKWIYSPWVDINIFADGRLFVWLLYWFKDELITEYLDNLKWIVNDVNKTDIKITSLEDIYWTDFDNSRKSLFSDKKVDLNLMIQDIKSTEYWKRLLTYIRDFYAKDIRTPLWLSLRESKNQWLNMATWVFSTTKSWWKVIEESTDENCIRLSCHPRPYTYEPWKIWIHMNTSQIKSWMPWHWVALLTTDWIKYIREKDAIEMWTRYVYNSWLPYYEYLK